MTRSYKFTYDDVVYELSTNRYPTIKMEAIKARYNIDTEKILVADNLTVSEIKAKYHDYKANGGTLKRKEYLNSQVRSLLQTEDGWDDVIKVIKDEMNALFDRGEFSGWRTEQDRQTWFNISQQGHATAALNLGIALLENNEDPVSILLLAHNNGAQAALLWLAVYFINKGEFLNATTCLCLSADCGNQISLTMLLHSNTIDYIRSAIAQCGVEAVRNRASDIASLGHDSSSRVLLLQIAILMGNIKDANAVLSSLLKQPEQQLKETELDSSFDKRKIMLSDFYKELSEKINQSSSGLPTTGDELVSLYNECTANENYIFPSIKDLLEMDKVIQEEIKPFYRT